MSYLRQRHSSYLEVNLGFLSQNIEAIRKRAGSAQILPMVKGNAYGNGIGPISRHLVEKCGISTLGVASLGEACYLATQCDDGGGGGDPGVKSQGPPCDTKAPQPYLPSTFDGRIVVFSDTEIHNTAIAAEWYKPPKQKPQDKSGSGDDEGGRTLTIVPVLQSAKDVTAFLDLPFSPQVPLWVKVNTGMNRLGITGDSELEEIIRILKSHPNALARVAATPSTSPSTTGERNSSSSPFSSPGGAHQIDHLLTHFSNADSRPVADDENCVDDRTEAQLIEFSRIRSKLEAAGLKIFESSTSNSAGITRGLHLDSADRWVRCGLMMYGPSAVFDDQGIVSAEDYNTLTLVQRADLNRIKPMWDGKQVCRLVTKALSVRLFQAGDNIGYGVFPLPTPPPGNDGSDTAVSEASIVVTLPLGYADGFVKYYTGMTVTIDGLHGQIHGGICMDTCFVSFPLRSLKAQMGDKPSVFTKTFALEDPTTWPFQAEQTVHIWEWGDNRSLQRMANEVKTITYALMCCLTPRIERVYVDGDGDEVRGEEEE